MPTSLVSELVRCTRHVRIFVKRCAFRFERIEICSALDAADGRVGDGVMANPAFLGPKGTSMFRTIRLLLLIGLLPLWAGCAMCSSCDDYSYGAFGGRWQRDDYVHGRVGSVFEPAGSFVVTDQAVSDEPVADEPAADEPTVAEMTDE